jgi:hypothetical protein
MYVAIDGVPLVHQPDTIDIVPTEPTVYQHGAGKVTVTDPGGCATINLNYENILAQGAAIELHRKRSHYGLHTLTVFDTRSDKLTTLNAYMPPVPHTAAQYDTLGRLSFANFTVAFKQVNPAYDIVCFETWFRGNIVAPAVGVYSIAVPSRCQFLSATGFVVDPGSVGNQLTMSMYRYDAASSSLVWMFAIVFVSSSVVTLSYGALADLYATFNPGDLYTMDVALVPTNPASDVCVKTWFKVFRP